MSRQALTAQGIEVPRYAVSSGDLDHLAGEQAAEWIRCIEGAGFKMLWISEVGGREAFTAAQLALTVSDHMVIANGVARALQRDPKTAAAAQATLVEQFPRRYVLGLGVSGASRERGVEPATFLHAYLHDMDKCAFEFGTHSGRPPRVIGAYSPALTRLASSHADGLVTFLVTPEHTAWARGILGERPFLSVVQWVVPDAKADEARRLARQRLEYYLRLPHQRAKLLRLGFSPQDIEPPGTDKLIDKLVLWGDAEEVVVGLQHHFAAGADQVATSILGPPDSTQRRRTERLANALELSNNH